MASGVDIGALSGRVEFEDKTSSTLDLIMQKVDGLTEHMGGLDKGTRAAAEGFFLAEAAIKVFEKAVDIGIELVKDFTTEGAAIGDVEGNFTHLTEAAGRLGSTLLGELRAGTHDTINDFELMKLVNSDMAAGLKLTDAQFRTMAEGAFALAQAKAIDVGQALEIMNEALLKGQPRALAAITGKVDMAKAEEAYAKSLGKSVDLLSDEGKLHADRLAILEAVSSATGRLGEQQDGLDEIIAQSKTAWTNWYNELIKTVATSPNVIHAFESVRDSLVAAFGGDSQSALETVVGWINKVADTVTEYAPIVVGWFKEIKTWIVSFYDAAVGAWERYGPTIISGFELVKELVLGVYSAVTTTWNALPDWMKNAAEKAALTTAGLYVLDKTVASAGHSVADFIGTMGNLTTTLSGLPAAFNNVVGGLSQLKLLAGLTTLEFTSFAGAKASIALLTESLWTMIAPLAPLAIAIGAVTLAWSAWEAATRESGWVRELSDGFEYAALRVMGYSAAESDAMIATDHMTQRALEQAKVTQQQTKATADAKSVTDQIKAALDAARAATEKNNEAVDHSADVLDKSKEEAKKYAEAWEQINAVNGTSKDVLNSLDGALVEGIKYYREAGIAMDKLKVAYELTDAQAAAVEDSFQKDAKAAQELADAMSHLNDLGKESWQLLSGIGDRVKDDVGRYHDLGASVKDLALAYGLTEAQVNAIIKTRDREAEATRAQNDAYEKQNGLLDESQLKVRTLSGEMITLAEAQERQRQGGSTEITKANLSRYADWFGVPQDVAQRLAELGFSFQEIVDAYRSGFAGDQWNGPNWKPKGPRIPGFRNGGYGDFGEGTLAMLHGREAIVPLDQGGAFGATFGPGSIVVNYPVMNDPRALSELRGMVGRAFEQSTSNRRLFSRAGA